MRLENIVWDARDPQRLGAFWAAALGAEPMTDGREGYEARLSFRDGFFLDLCFQPVAAPSGSPQRLHLDLQGGARAEGVEQLRDLGAHPVDIGQGEVPWTVLADPEGNPFCVMEHRDAYHDTGPIAALPLDSADPARDAAFWAAITGWETYDGPAPASLRHPSGTGPILELCPEPVPKQGKNRMHLDVRPDAGDRARDGDVIERVVALGGARFTATADLPWVVCADPSGNELCVLSPALEQAGPS